MRFSIRWLFLVTAVAAVIGAAYVQAELAYEGLILLQLALMSSAVLLLIAGPAHRRPFWIGFLLCGVAYPCFPGPSILRAVDSQQSYAQGAVVSCVIGIALMLVAGYATSRVLRDHQP